MKKLYETLTTPLYDFDETLLGLNVCSSSVLILKKIPNKPQIIHKRVLGPRVSIHSGLYRLKEYVIKQNGMIEQIATRSLSLLSLLLASRLRLSFHLMAVARREGIISITVLIWVMNRITAIARNK